jgi:SsrA-binding protein
MTEKKIVDIAKNKKAYHDYEIIDKLEAGVELKGTEIKSIREHKVNLKDSFARVIDGQVWVHNLHISPYDFGNIFNHDPTRPRRLLLRKKQITNLAGVLSQKGYTLAPLRIYIKGKYAKIELGVVKGKKLHDKRDAIRERDVRRDMDREIKNL